MIGKGKQDESDRKTAERVIILDRFLSRNQLATLAAEHKPGVLEGRSVNLETEPHVQRELASVLADSYEMEQALNSFELQKPVSPWFFGEHYTVEWSGDGVRVRGEGERESVKDEVRVDVAKIRSEHSHGIEALECLLNGREYVSYVEVDADELPERIRGADAWRDIRNLDCVSLTETENGNRYRVAREFVPILEDVLAEMDEGDGESRGCDRGSKEESAPILARILANCGEAFSRVSEWLQEKITMGQREDMREEELVVLICLWLMLLLSLLTLIYSFL